MVKMEIVYIRGQTFIGLFVEIATIFMLIQQPEIVILNIVYNYIIKKLFPTIKDDESKLYFQL